MWIGGKTDTRSSVLNIRLVIFGAVMRVELNVGIFVPLLGFLGAGLELSLAGLAWNVRSRRFVEIGGTEKLKFRFE